MAYASKPNTREELPCIHEASSFGLWMIHSSSSSIIKKSQTKNDCCSTATKSCYGTYTRNETSLSIYYHTTNFSRSFTASDE
eukprot:scaffold16119_cov162-Amphora_coffeaeformis.AAC.5